MGGLGKETGGRHRKEAHLSWPSRTLSIDGITEGYSLLIAPDCRLDPRLFSALGIRSVREEIFLSTVDFV
jgi:hypothetical protein